MPVRSRFYGRASSRQSLRPSRRSYAPQRRNYTSKRSVQPYSAARRPARRTYGSLLSKSRTHGSGRRLGRRSARRTVSRHSRAPKKHHSKLHYSKRRHTSKHSHGTRYSKFAYYGSKGPSAEFKAKVQESLSPPTYFEFCTGNITPPLVATTYATSYFFQPIRIANVGAPSIAITEVTCVPIYLYDYPTIATIINTMYASAGTAQTGFEQSYMISGHMEYTLRNMSTDTIKVDVIRWTPKKDVPFQFCGVTSNAAAPVDFGNIKNLIGYGLYEQGLGAAADASNTLMNLATINLKDLPIFTENIDFKVFTITMRPGQIRKFKIGVSKLRVNTLDIFFTNSAAFTNAGTWCKSFVPGATGLLFRGYASQGATSAGGRAINSAITYTNPEFTLTTKVNYTVFDWATNAERSQISRSIGTTGLQAGVAIVASENNSAIIVPTNA